MRTWLLACGLAPLLTPPAMAASGPPPAVMTAMLQSYGRYDPSGHCWQATANGSNDSVTHACLAVIHADEVAAVEGKRRYLVLQGQGEQACHSCGGAIAFMVFGGADGLRVLAHSPALPDGAYGQPTAPDQIVLQQLGASQWGWIERISGSGQDYNESFYNVWLLRKDQVVLAAQLPASHGSERTGACDRRGRTEDCEDITVNYRIDRRDLQASYYPIVLQVSGRKGRRRVSSEAIARFDLAQYAYQLSPGQP